MLKLKNWKEKFLDSNSEKRSLSQNDIRSYSTSPVNIKLDQKQVTLLTKWLEQLNREKLITITDQNDIVIMVGGKDDQTQQIFINSNDIDLYLGTNIGYNRTTYESDTINMSDIARILLIFGYVHESSGQLSFNAQTIALDNNELKWLTSIVREARPNPKSGETQVSLFDGENTQLLCIPYEHMPPTNDIYTVANYLFQNGNVRYDVNTGSYAYRYVEPDILLDEKIKSPERIRQHQFLSFHIRRIHVDRLNKRVELEFRYEPTRNLVLPARWYHQVLSHHFDRDYIIDILLANGGVIDWNTFIFMGNTYSLQETRRTRANSTSTSPTYLKPVNLSLKEKNDLIRRYINIIIENDGAKQDETNQLFVLENPTDGRRLYFTQEHSHFIRENQFHREDVIHVLIQNGQIKQDPFDYLLLYYNNQYIRLPSSFIRSSTGSLQNSNNGTYPLDKRTSLDSQRTYTSNTTTTVRNSEAEVLERYRNIIDYMCRHGLVIWDKPSKLIRLHFTDQTLLLPIDHLRSIIDPRFMSSSSNIEGVLPFTSRQLSQWLINNSYMTRKNF